MKIIKVDNFDRDHISDVLVAENTSKYYAECIVDLLNEKFSSDSSPDFYKSVEDNHKLHEFES